MKKFRNSTSGWIFGKPSEGSSQRRPTTAWNDIRQSANNQPLSDAGSTYRSCYSDEYALDPEVNELKAQLKLRARNISTATTIGGVHLVPQMDVSVEKDEGDDHRSVPVTLTDKQEKVLELMLTGKSVFFTGAAGTGKSHILRIFQDIVEQKGALSTVAFTAPTGVAACNVRGLTIHSWAGVGRGTDPIETIAAIVSRNREAKTRWLKTKTLVIDEISMLSAELFDKLSRVGSRIRQDDRPFGGLQVVVCGDFFQLPPVGLGANTKFCFVSETWGKMFSGENMVVLDKVFRQKDSTFQCMLHELRRGEISENTNIVLHKKTQEIKSNPQATANTQIPNQGSPATTSVRPTKLYSTNKDVDAVNQRELSRLKDNEGYEYRALDEGTDSHFLQQLRAGTKAPEVLELRVDAQVMLLKNVDTSLGLVNGARGVVRSFVRPVDGNSRHALLPMVEFLVNVGGKTTTETRVLAEDVWDIRQGDRVMASRQQLPLMLAWAISIHKSQGMTIPYLEVSFNGMFEYGQGYVALSRATDLSGLMLHSFDGRSVKAHPQVKAFYKSLGYMAETEATDGALISTTISDLAAKYSNTISSSSPSSQTGGSDDLGSGGRNSDGWFQAKGVRRADTLVKRPLVQPPTPSVVNDWASKRPKTAPVDPVTGTNTGVGSGACTGNGSGSHNYVKSFVAFEYSVKSDDNTTSHIKPVGAYVPASASERNRTAGASSEPPRTGHNHVAGITSQVGVPNRPDTASSGAGNVTSGAFASCFSAPTPRPSLTTSMNNRIASSPHISQTQLCNTSTIAVSASSSSPQPSQAPGPVQSIPKSADCDWGWDFPEDSIPITITTASNHHTNQQSLYDPKPMGSKLSNYGYGAHLAPSYHNKSRQVHNPPLQSTVENVNPQYIGNRMDRTIKSAGATVALGESRMSYPQDVSGASVAFIPAGGGRKRDQSDCLVVDLT